MTSFGNIKVFDHDVLSIACRTTGNSLTRVAQPAAAPSLGDLAPATIAAAAATSARSVLFASNSLRIAPAGRYADERGMFATPRHRGSRVSRVAGRARP